MHSRLLRRIGHSSCWHVFDLTTPYRLPQKSQAGAPNLVPHVGQSSFTDSERPSRYARAAPRSPAYRFAPHDWSSLAVTGQVSRTRQDASQAAYDRTLEVGVECLDCGQASVTPPPEHEHRPRLAERCQRSGVGDDLTDLDGIQRDTRRRRPLAHHVCRSFGVWLGVED